MRTRGRLAGVFCLTSPFGLSLPTRRRRSGRRAPLVYDILVRSLLVLGSGGCADPTLDQRTPRSLIQSYHRAISAQHYSAVLACWAPQYRQRVSLCLKEIEQLRASFAPTERLIGERWGPIEAWRYRRDLPDRELLQSPVGRASTEVGICWSKIKLVVEGDMLLVRIDDEEPAVWGRRIRGKWYVVPPWRGDADHPASQLARIHEQVQALRLEHDRGRRLLATGEMTRDDYWDEEWYAVGCKCGPWKRGIALAAIFVGRPDTLPARPLTFMIGARGDEGRKACWRVPRKGVGRGVLVEIDGKPVHARMIGPTMVVGTGYLALARWWALMLPKWVEADLGPGEHTLRYTVLSPGGTHVLQDGSSIPMLDGTLVSNTVTFTLDSGRVGTWRGGRRGGE